MVTIQSHKLTIWIMMWLLEIMNITYDMECIIVNVIYKGNLKLIILFQRLQLIAQRPITNIYENHKYLLIIKVHENPLQHVLLVSIL